MIGYDKIEIPFNSIVRGFVIKLESYDETHFNNFLYCIVFS